MFMLTHRVRPHPEVVDTELDREGAYSCTLRTKSILASMKPAR